MNWEKMTANDFEKAVKDTGVCIIAMGVLERHGNHLPLGTDFLNGHKLATAAADKEASVVFPPFYFGQIYEARCFPGTLTLEPKLLFAFVQNVLDEIGRNGFKKIIILNAHGGNDAFIKFLAQCQLGEEKPYQLYYYTPYSPERSALYKEVCETDLHGHACECETSISLHNHQELIKMETIDKEAFHPQRKLAHIPNLFTGLSWYSNYPNHYVGDASFATKEKGKKLFDFEVAAFAKFIRNVKGDKVLEQLSKEFHGKVNF